MSATRALPIRMVEKVWGRDELPAPFHAPAGHRIGEIWFEPPEELDCLLVKFLFTSEKLSVQVHPSDAQARDGEEGKEECWLILDADDEARIAIGLRGEASAEELSTAALDGSIEHMLEWHKVQAGDVFYLPAGTIHAIGPGINLVEVQQNSDTTFRLFDYGRPRELHLDRGLDVAHRGRYPDGCRKAVMPDTLCLVDGPHFRLDRVVGCPDRKLAAAYEGRLLALPLEGELGMPGGEKLASGSCAYAEALSDLDFTAARITLLMRPV